VDKPVVVEQPDREPVTIEDLLDRYDGDLAAAKPEELKSAQQTAWSQGLADAETARARRASRPEGRAVGGLGDVCDSLQGRARTAGVETFLLSVTDVERLMLELGAYFERMTGDADRWLDRDPAKGFDEDEVTRLREDREATYARLQADAAQVAQKADRLRTML
jgi:hypothetical protein